VSEHAIIGKQDRDDKGMTGKTSAGLKDEDDILGLVVIGAHQTAWTKPSRRNFACVTARPGWKTDHLG
jgi:hypothetical protein